MDAVVGCSVTDMLASVVGEIPYFEELVLRVVPNTVAERHGARPLSRAVTFALPAIVGLDNRLGGIIAGLMKRSFQCSPFDKKIVYEQLPADVDGNNCGRMFQIRHWHWFQ